MSQSSLKRSRSVGPWANRPGGWSAGASKKSRKAAGNRSLVVRQPGIVAPSQTVTLRYVDQMNLNPGIGGIAYQMYRANGMFDPDVSVGGHQPLGFDQWASFYHHYTVLSSRIKVTPATHEVTGGAAPNSLWGVTRQSNSSAPTNALTVIESGRGSYNVLGNNEGAFGVKPLSANFSAKREYSLRNDDMCVSDTRLTASVAADPTEQSYFLVYREGIPVSADAVDAWFIVEVEYTARFTERKELAQS